MASETSGAAERVAELEARVRELEAENRQLRANIGGGETAITQLNMQIEGLERDSARFRWIAENCAKITSAKMDGRHYWTLRPPGYCAFYGPTFESAIDASMEVFEDAKNEAEYYAARAALSGGGDQ